VSSGSGTGRAAPRGATVDRQSDDRPGSPDRRGGEGSPGLLVLNQMAGPLAMELVEDLAQEFGPVDLLTGHPDSLARSGSGPVRIVAAATYVRGGFGRRVLAWLHYLRQALFWLARSPRRTPVLVFSNPPLLPWLAGIVCGLRRQPYAVMVYDIYPDVLVGLGKISSGSALARLWRIFNRWAYERAGVVMTIGEYMAATLSRQFDPRRTAAGYIPVVYPWADTSVIRPLPKDQNWFAREHGQVDRLTVMYSGNMGIGHDLETMLAAAERLQSVPAVHFLFIGDGPKRALIAEAIDSGRVMNVTLLDWQPESVLPYSLTCADISLVSLEEGMSGLAVPSKTFYALAAGTPIVAISGAHSELSSIVDRYGCGWSLAPGSVEELTEILEKMSVDRSTLERLQRTSRAVAERIGSRSNTRTAVAVLRDVFGGSRQKRPRATPGDSPRERGT
jgi:colanic acid biosynthesis glycosyl transferase WcaI